MATRYVRAAIGAVNAGQSTGRIEIATFDDSKKRTLTGIWSSDATALIHTQLDVAGTVYADIDDSVFGKLNSMLDVNQDYDSNVKISYNVVNSAAGNLNAGQALLLRYEA